MRNLIHDFAPRAILVVAVGYCVLIVLLTVYRSLLGLRAKRRATYAIKRAMMSDLEFRALVMDTNGKSLSATDIERIKKAIRTHIQDLSQPEQAIIDAGLGQKNVRGVQRFVEDVVGHKQAA
jgi:hypothetical protein